MKTQNTSATARHQPLMGALVHMSQQTRIAENVGADGKSACMLQTSKLELNWCHGELLIRFTGSAVTLAKAGA
ncbi:hypothetical protein [Comamonas koreensis]|uniref:Uncharacterized protein n=1 Tax=Comamonas koreensis TaxID=160825 RepID=A0AAW4XV43_9BURK|nr:hypothetical protein [Comamonas koreensis]MCD2164893.1 hypothetical protein [Comamonas koreensis]